MTSLILLRHARTDYNEEGRLQGSLDVPLGEDGIVQSSEVAKRVVAEYGTALTVASSPLQRATGTADAVAALAGTVTRADARFAQRTYGAWEGHTWAEVREEWPREYERRRQGLDPVIPGWGQSEDVADRVAAGLRDVAAEAARTGARTVVIVSHGSAIMLGVSRLLGLPLVPSRLGYLPHGAWNEVRLHNGEQWRLRRYCAGA